MSANGETSIKSDRTRDNVPRLSTSPGWLAVNNEATKEHFLDSMSLERTYGAQKPI
jgi:hypothetical protein